MNVFDPWGTIFPLACIAVCIVSTAAWVLPAAIMFKDKLDASRREAELRAAHLNEQFVKMEEANRRHAEEMEHLAKSLEITDATTIWGATNTIGDMIDNLREALHAQPTLPSHIRPTPSVFTDPDGWRIVSSRESVTYVDRTAETRNKRLKTEYESINDEAAILPKPEEPDQQVTRRLIRQENPGD